MFYSTFTNLSLLFLLLVPASSVHNATLHLLNSKEYPNARCLDGSPYGIYFRSSPDNATATEKKSFMVVLNGGGLCTHKSDCTSRSKTELGTSTVWSSNFDLDSVAYLTTDIRNPFRNWNLIFSPYCTGDMHAGQRTSANNDTFGLYFSGYQNILATIDYLSTNYGLNSTGNTLVWSGGSAGGVGVFSTLDSVSLRLPNVRVVGAPVGGFPPEIYWSTTKGSHAPEEDVRTPAFKANNALYDGILPYTCANAMGSKESYKCAVPHIAYQYLQTPVMILESLTDVVISCAFEGMPCQPAWKGLLNPDNWKRWGNYGVNASAMFQSTVGQDKRGKNGLFAPSCLLHTGFTLDGPFINGINGIQATWNWMYPSSFNDSSKGDQRDFYVDSCKNNSKQCRHRKEKLKFV